MKNTETVIDWGLALKAAGDKKEVAEELLSLLVHSLPNELDQMTQSHRDDDHNALLKQLHRLHGAVSYCGVPRLKQAIISLETALKTQKSAEIPALFELFTTEAHRLIQLVKHPIHT